MRRSLHRVPPAIAVVAAIVLAATACGSSDADAPDPADGGAPLVSRPAAPTDAIAAGTDFLESQYGTIDIASLSVIAYLGRNWQLPDLTAAGAVADERSATADLHPEEEAMIRLADPLRLPDPAVVREIDAGTTTATLARVLRCDEEPLTERDVVALDALVDGGGYDATHAALAVAWVDELGCTAPDPFGRKERLVEAIATELEATEQVTDLAVEQSAVLHYLGAGGRIPGDWLDRVLAAQRTDGGWGERVSTWHMTLLAVWTILAETESSESVRMVEEEFT